MRTNIEIGDEIMKQAFSVSGLKTKREVVEQALSEFIQNRTRKNLMDIRGKISFTDGYDYKLARDTGNDSC
jgi:Arc/MetJ family transcription regulator